MGMLSHGSQAWVLIALTWMLVVVQAAPLLSCERAIPLGDGFGGTVTITDDCIWRPQLHFISVLSGEQRDYPGPLEAPIIWFEPAKVAPSQSGPSRLVLNNVVLANFTLSSPNATGVPKLWPNGMLQMGPQPGASVPRRLYMNDVKIVVDAQRIQEYVRFFKQAGTLVYTDNATFIHIPYWADELTSATSVGLLLGVPGAAPPALAGSRPVPGRNFVLAADQSTLLSVLQAPAVATSSSVPFLMYLSANISFSTMATKVQVLPINRPMYIVGKTTDVTSVDFGMDTNKLQLGPAATLTWSRVVLENLAPGDARSAALAGPYEVMLSFYLWAVAFSRADVVSPRLIVHNSTLVVSVMELEQYLFKATLFRVQPAGFDSQLDDINSFVKQWDASWVEASDSVSTSMLSSTALEFVSINVTASPQVAVRLALPDRPALAAAATAQHSMREYQLTHIGESVMNTVRLDHLGGPNQQSVGARELVMLTTNVTLTMQNVSQAANGVVPAGGVPAEHLHVASLEWQLRKFLADNVAASPQQRHVVMGIVMPPITLDLAYTQNFVALPPSMPPGYFSLVNLVAIHLSQGPRAAQLDATVLLPDVWTHLLWSIPRTNKNTVLLSNVTLWVPAAEFSFIRSHTGDQPSSFTINLQGDANMKFYNVHDLRAGGLYIERYSGPGLEAESLTLRVEAGWSMNGQPPRGFWVTSFLPDQQEGSSNKLSDAMVVVLAVCLVTAVVASVLACLAFVFWRKRVAESRMDAARAAADELKPGSTRDSHSQPPSQYGSGGHRAGTTSSSSGTGVLSGLNGRHSLPMDSTLVHDSSDSYHAQEDRAALTEELARSQFVPGALFGRTRRGSRHSSDGSGSGGAAAGTRLPGGRSYGGQQLPPAAAAVGVSNVSMASDAALQRLQSAITIMSQDVLSRRLQLAAGPEGGPLVGPREGKAGGLARPSPLGLQHQQQLSLLTPPPEAVVAASPDGKGQGGGAPNQQQLAGAGVPGSLAGSGSSVDAVSIARGSPNAAAAAVAGAAWDTQQRDASGGSPHAALNARLNQQASLLGPSQGGGAAVWAAGGAAAGAACPAKSAGSSSFTSSRGGLAAGGIEQLKLLQLVGQGTFGQVYKALWRRRCVAVKVLQLPATAGSSDAAAWRGMGRNTSHREKMAVMETVVSTTMSHPNIVQVYTYVLQPLMQGSLHSSNKARGSSPSRRGPPPQQQPPPLQDLEQQQPQQQLDQQLQQPLPPVQQSPAAKLLAGFAAAGQQQQQPQLAVKRPPDPGAAAGAGAADAAGAGPSDQQQQQQDLQQAVELSFHSQATRLQQQQQQQHASGGALGSAPGSSPGRSDRVCGSACGDSSHSLPGLHTQGNKDLSRLTPEMAKAAAAALPAACNGGSEVLRQQSLRGGAAGSSHGGSHGSGSDDADVDAAVHQGPVLVGWELRLVMEFCDAGSLRTALDHKLLMDRTTGLPALECVLFLAHDVACAMIHLHSEQLLHGDLKASNVLLKRTAPRLPVAPEQSPPPAAAAATSSRLASGQGSGAVLLANGRRRHHEAAGSLVGQGLGLMAKVADFGLSLTLGPTDTHVSQMHMGTLTHMAPELLLHGRASKASDVYAFGILLWELATGRRPYSGTPVGMLAHKVAQQGWRPAWPGGCSLPVQMLAESCWTQEPGHRPSFEHVVQQLEEMASHLDELKQQQAQAMAAAAAPLFHPGPGHHDSEHGHELTPSMMAELMPSGFSVGSACSDVEEEAAGSGVLYEMSQLSGCSADRALHLSSHEASSASASGDEADSAAVNGPVAQVATS